MRALLSPRLAPEAALVPQAVRLAVPPDAECIVSVAEVSRVQVIRDRAADDLGARHAFATADVGQLSYLLLGKLDDGAHDL